MRATITKALTAAGFAAAVAAAPAMAQGHPGHGHGDEAPRAGMMQEMMKHCPIAGGGMMGPDVLIEHAEELGLSAEQIAELETHRDRQVKLRSEMMEAMEAVHGVLTPEQREALHERMGGRMQGMHDMEGMHRMMHGMMRGGEHAKGGAMTGPGAVRCPMMRGAEADH